MGKGRFASFGISQSKSNESEYQIASQILGQYCSILDESELILQKGKKRDGKNSDFNLH